MIVSDILHELRANVPDFANPRVTMAFHDSTHEWAVCFFSGGTQLCHAEAVELQSALDKCLVQAAHLRKKPYHTWMTDKNTKPKRDLLG